MILEKVWLIFPAPDAGDDWAPLSVFVTWEHAVAVLKAEGDGHSYEIQHINDSEVHVWVTDDMERYGVRIVAVPIEYKG
jgi:hypothetical protein